MTHNTQHTTQTHNTTHNAQHTIHNIHSLTLKYLTTQIETKNIQNTQ